MQCLACYRDKRGIITHCKLSSNGIEKVFPKDEVKAMLRQKNKIDGLRLTSDNRLIQTDNKIALYVQSCEELGIIPLTIIKKDNRYILTGIPSGIRNIVIPKFVDAVYISRMNKQKEEAPDKEDVFKQYVNISDGMKYLYNVQLNTKNSLECLMGKELPKINEKLDYLLNKEVQVSLSGLATKEDIEKYVSYSTQRLQQLGSELKKDIENCTEDQIKSIQDLRKYLEENGEQLIVINKAVENKLNSIDEAVSKQLAKSTDTLDGIKYHKNNIWYVATEKEDIMLDVEKYEQSMKEYAPFGFIDYGKISLLTNMVCGYYQIMMSMQEQIKQIQAEGDAEYKRTDFVEGFNETKDKIGVQLRHDGVKYVINKVGMFTAKTMIKSAEIAGTALPVLPTIIKNSLSKGLSKLETDSKAYHHYIDTINKIGEPYDVDKTLERYCENSYDPDIARYLIESIYNEKSIDKLEESQYIVTDLCKRTANVYFGLQKLFADNANKKVGDTSITFDTDMRARIALSFICAIKLVRGRLGNKTNYMELPAEYRMYIVPYNEDSDRYGDGVYAVLRGFAEIDKPVYPKVTPDSLKRLYIPVLLEITYTCLLIQKIKPKIARDYIVNPLYKIYSDIGKEKGLYELEGSDLHSGVVRITDYVDKKYKVY